MARLHFRSAKLDHVLKRVDPKNKPPSWDDDNDTVCSQISQIVSDANYKHIRDFENDAAGMWERLRSTHQDHTSGGRVYWLQKLVLMRMEPGSDIEDHINHMHKVYERLNALVNAENPLTVDDIYATALLISIPEEWVSSINGLLLNPSTDSSTIIEALKRQSTYRKARSEKELTEVSVSKAKASGKTPSASDDPSKERRFCTFCRRHGHDLLVCNNAQEILSKAKKEYGDSKRDEVSSSKLSDKGKSKKLTKAAFVELGSSDSDDDDESVEAKSISVNASQVKQSDDINIDSGCGKSMTPHYHHLSQPVPKRVTVLLADDSIIKSTHVGSNRYRCLAHQRTRCCWFPTFKSPSYPYLSSATTATPSASHPKVVSSSTTMTSTLLP